MGVLLVVRIAVDGDRVVVLSRKQFTSDRVESLIDTATRFVAEAVTSKTSDGSAADPLLTDPLSSR